MTDAQTTAPGPMERLIARAISGEALYPEREAREFDVALTEILEANEQLRNDINALYGHDVPDDDELRELRYEIFRRAEGFPPESKTSEWADRAERISEALDDYCAARILAVSAARATDKALLADALATLQQIMYEVDGPPSPLRDATLAELRDLITRIEAAVREDT